VANFVYKKAKESLLKGEIDAALNNFKVLLIDTVSYTANQSIDQYVSDINSSAIKSRSENLSGITTIDGILDANDAEILNHDGSAFGAIILYQIGAADTSSRLIFYIDSSENLPYLGNDFSLPITIYWSSTNTKILSL